jgi:NADH:ubiquinone oxidoreductase subunit F (NADH-binding)
MPVRLPAIATLLRTLAHGRATRRDLRRLARYLHEVPGRGACHLPDGTASFVSSALATFAQEITTHLRGQPCAPGRPPLLPIPLDAAPARGPR